MAGPWEKYRSGAQGVPIGMQDPTMPYRAQGAALDNQGKAANIQNDAARIALERQRLELARQAAARAAEASAAAQRISKQQTDGKVSQLRALENQIARTRGLFTKGPGSTKPWTPEALLDYLPTETNKRLDTAGAGLSEVGFAAFRVPGAGSQSDAELRQFLEANRPSVSDNDVVIDEKLRNLENRLGEAYKPYGRQYKPAKAPPRKPKTGGGWKIERLD